MAYDPTKPANNSPIVAAELRNQFAGLNDYIQQRALSIDVTDSINAQSAGSVVSLPPPDYIISNPPTQAQVQAMADYLNQLYVALSRT